MKSLGIKIKTLSPVVLTASKGETVLTEAQEVISGSNIRGIFSNMYIEKKNLPNAHEDEVFCKLFFANLSFVDAMPLCGGKRGFVAPRSLQKGKSGSDAQGKVIDLSLPMEAVGGFKGYKGIITLDGKKINNVSVDKQISLHMSRSEDSERIAGKSVDGNIFNYEAIAANQEFMGNIIGSDELVDEFIKAIDLKVGKKLECRVGKSRFTQYGKVVVSIEAPKKIESIKLNRKLLTLRLETPFIPSAGIVINSQVALQEAMNTLGYDVEVANVFGAIEEIDNFVGIWGMRRPRVNAVSAGTVFALKKQGDWSSDELTELQELMYEGIGIRTEEGFGQLRLWDEETLSIGEDVDCYSFVAKKDKIAGEAATVAQNMVRKFIISKIREYAFNAANGVNIGAIKGKAHFFTRIDNLLGDKSKIKERSQLEGEKAFFKKAIEGELRATATEFSNNLRDICINNRSLYDLLVSGVECPYMASWKDYSSSNKENIGKLMKQINMRLSDNDIADGEYFYEYWHWFFRYARKRSGEEK